MVILEAWPWPRFGATGAEALALPETLNPLSAVLTESHEKKPSNTNYCISMIS